MEQVSTIGQSGKKSIIVKMSRHIRKNTALYLMSVPGLLYLLIYKFLPLYGLTLAFKDFNIFAGDTVLQSLQNSPWVGWQHFEHIFSKPEFIQVLKNTIIISIYKIVFLFPMPIILALLLNEVRREVFKRTIQTLVYLPHFLSWIIIFGLFFSILGTYGLVNQLLGMIGFDPIKFFTDSQYFRGLLVVTEGWKEVGWSAIIFLAAMTSIDPQIYEAAMMDGANRFKRMIYITVPGILPVIVLILILRIGQILNAGFEQILAMYNPAVYDVADTIQTYIYRVSLGQLDFSTGTAFGLFESVIAFILIISSNAICRKTLGKSLW